MVILREIKFGPFRIDPTNCCIWHGTIKRNLPPKDFALLNVLASSPGILVTKKELLKTVWAQTSVGDHVLKTCIGRIRKILQDDHKTPKYIETVHRRGYRFVCQTKIEQVGISPTAPQISIPHSIVGRTYELKKLFDLLEFARIGTRQTVFVSGEAGIGKTTLVNTFYRRAKNRYNMLVVGGQCVEHYGAGEPYLPILEALSSLCRNEECSLVISILKRYAPLWLLQLPWLLSEDENIKLQRLMVGTTPAGLLRELVESLEIISNQIPLILIIEDLHWSDAATLDAFNALSRRKETAHLMIIGTYRPEELPTSDHPLNRIVNDLNLKGINKNFPLTLLSKDDMVRLLTTRYPDRIIPEIFIDWLHRHSEGNPLFINALLDHVENLGLMNYEEAFDSVIFEYGSLTPIVPATLRQLIENTLSQLSDDERSVIEVGSVVGKIFPVKTLAASAEVEEQVDTLCNRLAKRNQMLCSAGFMDWPDGTKTPCYSFMHSFHQQVTYDAIPPLKKQKLHFTIGQRLENEYRNDIGNVASSLAIHFSRGLEYRKAVFYSQIAGEIAIARHAYKEVVSHMERGLRLLHMIPDEAEREQFEIPLRIMHGTTLVASQGYASKEVENAYSRAHELCLKSKAHPQFMPVLFGLWMYYLARADFIKSWEVADYYYRTATKTRRKSYLVWAHTVRGLTNWYQGQLPVAHSSAVKCVSCYEPKQQQVLIQQHGVDAGLLSWGHEAMSLCIMGYSDQACEEGQKALSIAKETSGPFMVASVLAYTISLYLFRREFKTLINYTDELISLANKHGLSYWLSLAGVIRGWRLGMQGRSSEGITQILNLIEAYQATGAKLMLNFFKYLLADVYYNSGQIEEGLKAIDESLALTNLTDARWIEGDQYRLKGDLYLMGTSKQAQKKIKFLKEAKASFIKAIEISVKQQAKLFELRATIGLSRVLNIQRRRSESVRILVDIYGWFNEGFDTSDLKQAKELIDNLSYT